MPNTQIINTLISVASFLSTNLKKLFLILQIVTVPTRKISIGNCSCWKLETNTRDNSGKIVINYYYHIFVKCLFIVNIFWRFCGLNIISKTTFIISMKIQALYFYTNTHASLEVNKNIYYRSRPIKKWSVAFLTNRYICYS